MEDNMSLASMMDSKATCYRLPISQDDHGGTLQQSIAGLTPIASNLPCSFQESSPSTRIIYGQRTTVVQVTMYFMQNPNIEVNDVVVVTKLRTKEVITCLVTGQSEPVSKGRLWQVSVERVREPQ